MASLSYAQLVQVLPVSLFGVSVAAVTLPDLSRDAASAQPHEVLRARLATGFRRIAFFVVPAAFAFVVLGDVIVAALFETGRFQATDTAVVGGVLAAYGIGLLGAASAKLFASGFFALRDTRTPVKISVATLLLSGALAALLLRPLGVAGIALGSSVGASVTFLAQLRLLDARIGPVLDRATWRHCGISVAAALGAAGAGALAAGAAADLGSLGRGAAALAAFGVVYAGLTLLLQHPDAVRLWTLRR